MLTLSLGSHGADVSRLEQRLKELQLYTGSIDGAFGGGVLSAVKAFQRKNNIPEDGIVGPLTWAALFPGTPPPAQSELAAQPLAVRCLALTGTFETSTGSPDCYCGLTGNFDGQGISFGVLQWNLGQGTLQPMLTEMIGRHRDLAATIFADSFDALSGMLGSARAQQIRWASSIQDSRRFTVFEPWRGFFRALGRTPEFQQIQVEHADALRRKALTMCQQFGVGTERALALMFDICVQNGSINQKTTATILADFKRLDPGDSEQSKLRAIANRRAEAARPESVEDVRARKLTIANGQGTVHNITYNLEQQFGIRLVPVAG